MIERNGIVALQHVPRSHLETALRDGYSIDSTPTSRWPSSTRRDYIVPSLDKPSIPSLDEAGGKTAKVEAPMFL